jgi:OHCU decarboxylase
MPYTLDANDMRFATPQGFNSGDQFFTYLKDSFDLLYAEGESVPKMMSIGLHCRLAGRPGRAASLARFLDYVAAHRDVWVATRLDIARHWVMHHKPDWGWQPSSLSKPLFMARFGGVFEHSPWVAEGAFAAGLDSGADSASGLHRAMVAAMRRGTDEQKRALILAHPDLAGKLALAKQLTADSTAEQASAGLDRLSADELSRFTELNDAYKSRFGFPFILAVKGRGKAEILQAFETRLAHDSDTEFSTALAEIEKIAAFRLADIMPDR